MPVFTACQIICYRIHYLSWHIRSHWNGRPQRRVDSKKHHPESDAAPDGYVAELWREGICVRDSQVDGGLTHRWRCHTVPDLLFYCIHKCYLWQLLTKYLHVLTGSYMKHISSMMISNLWYVPFPPPLVGLTFHSHWFSLLTIFQPP